MHTLIHGSWLQMQDDKSSNVESFENYSSLIVIFFPRSKFEFEFKTDQPDGLIFYMADTKHIDFMSVYMKDGHLHYDFNCGSGAARMVSNKRFNNNTWHIVSTAYTLKLYSF